MSTEKSGVPRSLLRPPRLPRLERIVLVYAVFAMSAAVVAFAVYPILADPRPWPQKLAFYTPPIGLGLILGSPALRKGSRWVLDLLRRPTGRSSLHPAHK